MTVILKESDFRFGQDTRTKIMNQRKTIDVCAVCWHWHERPRPVGGKSAKRPVQCRECGRVEMITFPSEIEAVRAGELRLQQRCEIIRDLEFHPKFTAPIAALEPFKGGRDAVITYTADSHYTVCRTGEYVIEDVKPKGKRIDPRYKLVRPLFSTLLGVEIKTIYR